MLCSHGVGGNRKHYQQSTNVDQKSIETVFSIVICRQCGDKWQSNTLFLTIFDQRSSIVLALSIAAYPVWCYYHDNISVSVPGMVGSLNFVDIRDTWLKVNWTEPGEINGVLQGNPFHSCINIYILKASLK